jgi:hypothetical protein
MVGLGRGVKFAFDHVVEFVEHHLGFFFGLAFDGGGHH